MLYSDPTAREYIDYTDTETALTPEIASGVIGEVAVRALTLKAILNNLPDRSGDSLSDTSSEE